MLVDIVQDRAAGRMAGCSLLLAINDVLTVAAISLHFLDLEAICPNIRFSCEGAT